MKKTDEIGKRAPANLSRNYGSRYKQIGVDGVYRQEQYPKGKQWFLESSNDESITEVRTTIEIGDWNMDTQITRQISHLRSATEWKTIRSVSIIVRNDADTIYYDSSYPFENQANELGLASINGSRFIIARRTSGNFDSVDFDSTSYNRGWITFWYTPDA